MKYIKPQAEIIKTQPQEYCDVSVSTPNIPVETGYSNNIGSARDIDLD